MAPGIPIPSLTVRTLITFESSPRHRGALGVQVQDPRLEQLSGVPVGTSRTIASKTGRAPGQRPGALLLLTLDQVNISSYAPTLK